jgi:hypothetical protein
MALTAKACSHDSVASGFLLLNMPTQACVRWIPVLCRRGSQARAVATDASPHLADTDLSDGLQMHVVIFWLVFAQGVVSQHRVGHR